MMEYIRRKKKLTKWLKFSTKATALNQPYINYNFETYNVCYYKGKITFMNYFKSCIRLLNDTFKGTMLLTNITKNEIIKYLKA